MHQNAFRDPKINTLGLQSLNTEVLVQFVCQKHKHNKGAFDTTKKSESGFGFSGFLHSMYRNQNWFQIFDIEYGLNKQTRSSAIAVIADRTACSILTLFIVIATSRPLNKKICSLSVPGSNNYCGSASASGRVRSPHTSAARFTALCHC